MQTYIEILIVILLLVLIIERFYGHKNKTQKKPQKEKPVKHKASLSIMGETKHIPKIKTTVAAKQEPTKPIQGKMPKATVIPTEELDEVFSNTEDLDLSDEEEELQSLRSLDNDNDFATGLSFEELQKIPQMIADDKLTANNVSLAIKLSGTELLETINKQIPQAQKRVSDLIDSYLNSPKAKNDNWESFDINEFV